MKIAGYRYRKKAKLETQSHFKTEVWMLVKASDDGESLSHMDADVTGASERRSELDGSCGERPLTKFVAVSEKDTLFFIFNMIQERVNQNKCVDRSLEGVCCPATLRR